PSWPLRTRSRSPGWAVGTGAARAGRTEQAGEGEGVRNGHEGSEQVAAGQDEQRPRPQDAELAEEEHGGDQIVDHEGRFVDRDESADLRERQLRKWRRGEENCGGREHHCQREAPLAALRGQGRKEYPALARQPARFHLTSSDFASIGWIVAPG